MNAILVLQGRAMLYTMAVCGPVIGLHSLKIDENSEELLLLIQWLLFNGSYSMAG